MKIYRILAVAFAFVFAAAVARATLIRGESPASGGGAAAAALQWRTALEIDFAAQANQTLSSDGDYTIGDYTFTKFGTSAEAAAMAVVNGTGLVIQPNQTSNIAGATFDAPGISIGLTDLIPTIKWSDSIRVWVSMGGTFNDSYKTTVAGLIRRGATNSGFSVRHQYYGSDIVLQTIVMNNADSVLVYAGSPHISETWQMFELPDGIQEREQSTYSGSSTTDTDTSMLFNYRPTNTNSFNVQYMGALADWDFYLAAYRANAFSAFSGEFYNLKIEVLR